MTSSGPAHQRKRGATVSLPEQSSSGSHCDGGPGSQHTGPGLCKDGLLHTKRTGLAMSCQYQGVSVIGLEAAPETEHSKSCEQHWLSVFCFEKTWNLSRKSAEVILGHFKRRKSLKKEASQRTRSASIKCCYKFILGNWQCFINTRSLQKFLILRTVEYLLEISFSIWLTIFSYLTAKRMEQFLYAS